MVLASGVQAGDAVLTQIPQALSPGALVQIVSDDGSGKRDGKAKGEAKDKAGAKAEAKE